MSRHAQRSSSPGGTVRRGAAVLAGVAVIIAGSLGVSQGLNGEPSASRSAVLETQPTTEPFVLRVQQPHKPLERRTVGRTGASLRDRAERQQKKPVVITTSFRVSSFNVLGAAHTAKGGNKPGFGTGATRMRWTMGLLNGAGITVAGLQEFEPPQLATFNQVAPVWNAWPTTRPGLSNAVVWRGDVWEMVEGGTIPIPYFHGQLRPMPYVLLRHRVTGGTVWFANFHNPANARGPAARWRAAAVAKEAALVNSLSANGTPVILTGDMNDRAPFYCSMTARTQMHAANGGAPGAPCQPPGDMGIDWIMGSPAVSFTSHTRVRSGLVARTSDHPLVWAEATAEQTVAP